MSGSSKPTSKPLSFSSLARVLPKSAPPTPQGQSESKRSDVKDYFSLRRRSRVGSIPSVIEEKEKDREPRSVKQIDNPISPISPLKEKVKARARPASPAPLIMSPSSTFSASPTNGTANGHSKGESPTPVTAKRLSAAGSIVSRHGSISSLSFKIPSDPSLPQGDSKGIKASRIRESSPPPQRFRSHVAFDSVPAGDATKSNTASVVLNYKHQGYHATRRSRTFMVGLDEHSYSDFALEYLLGRLVDDGDHVVCVSVMEKDVRSIENSYRDQARMLMEKVMRKNYDLHDAAINVTLEYAVGKLHNTFQRLIQLYEPGMLIVGTKGRSGGIQGLMGARNSFSKYCLQYSPVPVVVVRPDEQRAKKKNKRKLDPTRGSYAKILARSAAGGVHEADSEGTESVYELESKLSKDEEAHKVAQAIGLPGSFDPTLKPLNLDKYLSHRPAQQAETPAPGTSSLAPSVQPPNVVGGSSDIEDGSGDDEGEDSDVEGDAEFEVEPAHVTKQQKERLHMMEVGEAAALLKHDEGEDDDDDNSAEGDEKDKNS